MAVRRRGIARSGWLVCFSRKLLFGGLSEAPVRGRLNEWLNRPRIFHPRRNDMRFFRPSAMAALFLVALLGIAATGAAHACPNSEAQAAEDGGE
jgi:hypothetical protein